MPATAAAVSGHALAVSSRLNPVERLVVGADGQLAAAWQPSQCPAAGGSIRDWESCAGPSSAAPTVTRRTPLASGTFSHQKTLGQANLQLKAAPWCPRVYERLGRERHRHGR
jgi:hypothetical protein